MNKNYKSIYTFSQYGTVLFFVLFIIWGMAWGQAPVETGWSANLLTALFMVTYSFAYASICIFMLATKPTKELFYYIVSTLFVLSTLTIMYSVYDWIK